MLANLVLNRSSTCVVPIVNHKPSPLYLRNINIQINPTIGWFPHIPTQQKPLQNDSHFFQPRRKLSRCQARKANLETYGNWPCDVTQNEAWWTDPGVPSMVTLTPMVEAVMTCRQTSLSAETRSELIVSLRKLLVDSFPGAIFGSGRFPLPRRCLYTAWTCPNLFFWIAELLPLWCIGFIPSQSFVWWTWKYEM